MKLIISAKKELIQEFKELYEIHCQQTAEKLLKIKEFRK